MNKRTYYLHKQASSPLLRIGTGALIGTGIGSLVDFLFNNKEREKENYRAWKRPLLYALLGSIPGLLQAGSQYSNSFMNTDGADAIHSQLDKNIGILDPLLLSHDALKDKSRVYRLNMASKLSDLEGNVHVDDDIIESLDDRFGRNKTASLYKKALGWYNPTVPVNAFNQSVYNTPGMNQNATQNIPNTLNATQTMTGAPWVSPAQIAGTLVNAGVGAATGAVIGKTIGALCGISPQTYNTIKNMGMYAGMMNTMGNAIARY